MDIFIETSTKMDAVGLVKIIIKLTFLKVKKFQRVIVHIIPPKKYE
jgi:hypothetical protein